MGDLKLAINVGTVQVAILVQVSGVVGAGDRVVLNSEVGVGKLKIMEGNKTNPIGRQKYEPSSLAFWYKQCSQRSILLVSTCLYLNS